jgi:hypothetical protein
MASPETAGRPAGLARDFGRIWQVSTANSNITLYSFRRFKTTHLLNLRFLEAELSELDHKLYYHGRR